MFDEGMSLRVCAILEIKSFTVDGDNDALVGLCFDIFYEKLFFDFSLQKNQTSLYSAYCFLT